MRVLQEGNAKVFDFIYILVPSLLLRGRGTSPGGAVGHIGEPPPDLLQDLPKTVLLEEK